MSDELEDAEEHTPWPAFVDLLSATSLLFVAFVGVFIYIAAARRSQVDNTRQYLYRRLEIASNSGQLFTLDPTEKQFVRVILREQATFPANRYEWETLRDEGKIALTQIANVLNDTSLSRSYREVRVLGYTDQDAYPGTAFSNWELSASRAAVVARYLVDQVHVDPCKITATGRGPYFPIRGEPKEASRRIEIQVVPALKDGSEIAGCDSTGDGTRFRQEAQR